jgi:hypothetical protein
VVALAVASAMCLSLCLSLAHAAGASELARSDGWRSTGVQEELVVHAARFAMQEQNRLLQVVMKLIAIKHARRLEGSGMQLSMNLRVRTEGKKRLAIAVVWVRPDGGMELTRWHWV